MQEIQTKENTRILGRQVGREISTEEINAVSGARWVPEPTITISPAGNKNDTGITWVY